MKKTTALVFDHRNRTKDGQKGPVEVRVTVNRRSYYFGTGVSVRRSEFVAGRVVNCTCADKLNERIVIVYNRVMFYVNQSIEAGEDIDVEYIKRKVWETVKRHAEGDTLLDWMHEQIPQLAISEGTRAHFYLLESRLREFGRIRRWEDATPENICQFDAWLHALRKPQSDAAVRAGMAPQLLSDNSVYNYHKRFKTMLNRADRFGLIDRSPYDKLKGQFKRGERENTEYLTEDEMTRIRQLELPYCSALDAARDLFVFQAFTGLSYSDAQAFDFSKYKYIGETWRYVGDRIKTGVPFVSELLPPAVAVLEKYHGGVPNICNADYNRRLKVIGNKANIQTRLHSHLARHTFATWMLSKGAKIENVSRMLGHTNIVQTTRYAKVLAQSVHEDYERARKGL